MCLKFASKCHSSVLDPSLLSDRTFDVRNDFSEVFELLLSTRNLSGESEGEGRCVSSNQLSSDLQVLVESNIDKLYALPRGSQYTRNIIGTAEQWIGYICRWEKHTASAIHGHPSFVYYQVLEGEIQMVLYKQVQDDMVTHERSINMTRGDTIWNRGAEACYDNLIHRVSTLESSGFTLHLFSEDPALGQHFSEV